MWYAIGIGIAVLGFATWLICHYWAVFVVIFAVILGAVVALGVTFVLNLLRRDVAYGSAFPDKGEDFTGKEYVGFWLSVVLGGAAGYWFGFDRFLIMLYTLVGVVLLSMAIIVWRGIVEAKKEKVERIVEQRRIEEEDRKREEARQEIRKHAAEAEKQRAQRLWEEEREKELYVQSLYDMRISQKGMMAMRALCDKRCQELRNRWGDYVEEISTQVRDITAWADADKRQTYADAFEGDRLFRFVKKGGDVGDIIPPHIEIIISFSVHGARYKAYLRFNEEKVFFARFGKDRICETEWKSVLNEIDGYIYAGDEAEHGCQSARRETRW